MATISKIIFFVYWHSKLDGPKIYSLVYYLNKESVMLQLHEKHVTYRKGLKPRRFSIFGSQGHCATTTATTG